MHLAIKFIKSVKVPADGDCGTNSLTKILHDENLIVYFQEIRVLLKLTDFKTPIWLEINDLATVLNHFNFNLMILDITKKCQI